MKKKSKNLKRKIANYSLVAAGALTMFSACKKEEDNNPNIMEMDIEPDISLTAPTGSEVTADIDFNNDGLVDVIVTAGNYDYTNYGFSNNFNYGYFSSNTGSEFLTSNEVVAATGGSSFDLVRGLSNGDIISASQSDWTADALLGMKGTYAGQDLTAGNFFGSDKFVGVRFNAAGNTHYAWMLVGMAANGTAVTVKEYAYHNTPNTPLEAGDK